MVAQQYKKLSVSVTRSLQCREELRDAAMVGRRAMLSVELFIQERFRLPTPLHSRSNWHRLDGDGGEDYNWQLEEVAALIKCQRFCCSTRQSLILAWKPFWKRPRATIISRSVINVLQWALSLNFDILVWKHSLAAQYKWFWCFYYRSAWRWISLWGEGSKRRSSLVLLFLFLLSL